MNIPRDENERRRVAAEDAADWQALLEERALTPGERAALADWLRESPLHVAEMMRTGRLNDVLKTTRSWPDSELSAHSGDETVVALRPRQARSADDAAVARSRSARYRMVAALAAGLAAVALLIIGTHEHWQSQVLHNVSAEFREFSLEDGSRVRLAPDTELRVEFGTKLRALELARGAAEFRVVKDPTRPFVVQAALARIEAVGTIFTVDRTESAVTVSVTEGRVHVLPVMPAGEPIAAMPLALKTNERVRLSVGGEISEFNRAGETQTPAASTQTLVFKESTVREVVRRFNQQNVVQVVIADDELARRRVTGFFNPGDPQSFVDFLVVVAGAQVSRSASGEIVVSVPREMQK